MSRNNSYHIGVANIASCKIWPLPILLDNFGEQFGLITCAAKRIFIYCVYWYCVHYGEWAHSANNHTHRGVSNHHTWPTKYMRHPQLASREIVIPMYSWFKGRVSRTVPTFTFVHTLQLKHTGNIHPAWSCPWGHGGIVDHDHTKWDSISTFLPPRSGC